jgi:hypothetical protein
LKGSCAWLPLNRPHLKTFEQPASKIFSDF